MSNYGRVADFLVRRGMEAFEEQPTNPEEPNKPNNSLFAVGASLFFIAVVIFVIANAYVNYVYGKVVATLAAVEDPNPDVYVRIENDAPVDTQIHDSEADVPPPKPVTNSLKGTLSHLQARPASHPLGRPNFRARFAARFRGFRMFFLLNIAVNIVASTVAFVLPKGLLFTAIAQFVAEILLANVRVAWIHIIISVPSTKSLWSRVPAWRKTVMKIAPVAAIRSVASLAVTFIPLLIASETHLISRNYKPSDDITPTAFIGGGLGLTALFLVLYVLIQMPAEVTFIRVAASMLPEDDETIVPFDRSFGGKVTPEIVGGQGKIGIVDAWRSFSWASRMRFLKVVFKVFLMQIGIWVVFAVTCFVGAIVFFSVLGVPINSGTNEIMI